MPQIRDWELIYEDSSSVGFGRVERRADGCHSTEIGIGLLSCSPEYWGCVIIAGIFPE